MRIVVVSGASSGIGFAAAERFARAGDQVYNLDVKPPETAVENVTWLETDVADWSAVEQAVAHVHGAHGRIDVVIANAGISLRRGVLDITVDDAPPRGARHQRGGAGPGGGGAPPHGGVGIKKHTPPDQK
ncbi:SDR family NAD(P)-dependent oxidoreductase, partial [Streptomyces sp. NPDC054829]